MDGYYFLKNIRALLVEGFSIDDLRYDLCRYEDDFRPLFNQLSESGGKAKIVHQIIEYSHQQLIIDKLLGWAKERNLNRYNEHKPYLQEPSANTLLNLTAPLDENHLGYGIYLGGLHRGISLKVAAVDWVSYGQNGIVRVGWLYIPQYTEGHAVTFFKMHLSDEGAGYVHITDVANPPHRVWLKTQTGFQKEDVFDYLKNLSAVWTFTWKHTNYRIFPTS